MLTTDLHLEPKLRTYGTTPAEVQLYVSLPSVILLPEPCACMMMDSSLHSNRAFVNTPVANGISPAIVLKQSVI
jgi:hypothetical protein